MIVDTAFLGARGHYSVPRLLNGAGMLGRFFTDTYIGDKRWLELGLRLFPPRLRPKGIERLLGRKDAAIPAAKVVSFDSFGLEYWWKQRTSRGHEGLTRVFSECTAKFNKLVIREMRQPAEIVYACSGALELLQFVQASGGVCVYEQLLAAREEELTLLGEEKERWPGWQPDLWLPEINDPLTMREQNEWERANIILAASEFVAGGLVKRGVPRSKIAVVPYGVDLSRFDSPGTSATRPRGRLRVLFAGAVGLRKGAPDLLEALRLVGPGGVEARFAGTLEIAEDKIIPYKGLATFLGAVPRNKMPQLFRWADVLAFPTVCDGYGLVQAEALASGIPVVTTANCGSVVRDGVDGHIVPARNAEALAAVLDRYVVQPDHLNRQKEEARAGRDRLGLDPYGKRLTEAIKEL
jgi:glycosyltransferase involved in cell wall biosynthesis